MVDRFAQRVRREEGQTAPGSHPSADLQRVVPRAGVRKRRPQQTEGWIKARTDRGRRRKDGNGGIDLHEDRQVRRPRTDVADFEPPAISNLLLDGNIEML